MCKVWGTWNFGTPPVCMSQLLIHDIGASERALTLTLSHHMGDNIPFMTLNHWKLFTTNPTAPFSFTFQTRIHESSYPVSARSEVWHHLQTCSTQGSKKTSRITTAHTAHLLSIVNKISSLLEYQGALTFVDAISFLWRMTHLLVHDLNISLLLHTQLVHITNSIHINHPTSFHLALGKSPFIKNSEEKISLGCPFSDEDFILCTPPPWKGADCIVYSRLNISHATAWQGAVCLYSSSKARTQICNSARWHQGIK